MASICLGSCPVLWFLILFDLGIFTYGNLEDDWLCITIECVATCLNVSAAVVKLLRHFVSSLLLDGHDAINTSNSINESADENK